MSGLPPALGVIDCLVTLVLKISSIPLGLHGLSPPDLPTCAH